MLESGSADQNQEDLLNLLGVDAVEFVFEILNHREALLHGDDDHAVLQAMENEEERAVSQRPLDDLGLSEEYLAELKKNGLNLPSEPTGWKKQYAGYMSGVKLNHNITTDERIGGRKTYHDVAVSVGRYG